MGHLLGNLATLDAGVAGEKGVVGDATDRDGLPSGDIDLDWAARMAEATKGLVSGRTVDVRTHVRAPSFIHENSQFPHGQLGPLRF